MITSLNYSPGQQATIVFQIFGSDGSRSDGYDGYGTPNPIITRIILPNLTLAAGYPVMMSRLDTGLYYFKFTLPSGSASIGTYIVDISWFDPSTAVLKSDIIQIIVSAQSGNYSISPG